MAAVNGFSGSGSITGDPHFDVNGKKFDYQGTSGDFYNVLSDSGIEVNDQFGKYSNTANIVEKTGIAIGQDHIEVDAGGHVLLNAVTVQDGTYLNGELKVSNGTVEIKADHYDITIHDNGRYLDTNIVADNAGSATDVPTGIWGSVLADPNAVTGPNYGDKFQVKGLFQELTVPDLPPDATPQQSLEFEKKLMLFNIAFHADETGTATQGDANTSAASKQPQG